MSYLLHRTEARTPGQMRPMRGREDMTPNNAGGFGWTVSDWQRLDRWLILGSCGGTYYVGQHDLTKQNTDAIQRCITQDGQRVLARIIEVSGKGLAPRNDQALYVLAMCAAAQNAELRQAALAALPRVARIGTHLFQFNAFAEQFRGRGTGLNRAVRRWYADKPLSNLAYQVVKYQERGGWSHRDLLRLVRGTKTADPLRDALYHYVVHGWDDKLDAVVGLDHSAEDADAFAPIVGFERAKRLGTEAPAATAALIREFQLPFECVPSELLRKAETWLALLPHMGLTALIRNMGNMTRAGIFEDQALVASVAQRITDATEIVRARIHPLAFFAAYSTYQSGHSEKGKGEWKVIRPLAAALSDAFYMAFPNLPPTGKRLVVGIDVSGSMKGTPVNGIPNAACDDVAAALALLHHIADPGKAIFKPFDIQTYQRVEIADGDRLEQVAARIAAYGGGSTDCAQPVRWALDHAIETDAFIIYTDSESWAGTRHAAEVLEAYRARINRDARLVVVQMASNHTSIADPTDPRQLDCIGCDPTTPQAIAAFLNEQVG